MDLLERTVEVLRAKVEAMDGKARVVVRGRSGGGGGGRRLNGGDG